METVATMNTEGVDLYAAQNPLDLVLCRGAGLCSIDFTKDEELEKWKGERICSYHLKELLQHWSNRRYDHIQWRKQGSNRVEVCTMPSSPNAIWTSHPAGSAPIVKRRHVLEKTESEAILELHGVLIHPGIRKNIKNTFCRQRKITFEKLYLFI